MSGDIVEEINFIHLILLFEIPGSNFVGRVTVQERT
jgi:hypothetical protein